MVTVSISGSSKETGALFVELLNTKGLYKREAKACVCYGGAPSSRVALNAMCVSDKIERLHKLQRAGVTTIPWSETGQGLKFPLLARSANGYGGTDIVPVFQKEDLPWRLQAGFSWFSEYVPVKAEYRVWVYRDEHLGTYTKVMRRPRAYKYIGRNFRNGFDFEPCQELPQATTLAIKGIAAVGLDFAAVDMLQGLDDRFYILELNTAPGVLKSKAQPSLYKLVDCVEAWVTKGYPQW